MDPRGGRRPGGRRPVDRESAFRRLAARRLAGEPLQYVLGTLAVPLPRAAGRPAGPHPPSGDRAGGRGGPGRAACRSWAAPAGRVGRRWWPTWAPGRGPSPCRWPSRPARVAGPRGLGHRSLGTGARGGRGQPRPACPTGSAASGARVRWPRGGGSRPAARRWRGRVDLVVSNPPYVAGSRAGRARPRGAGLGARVGPGGRRRDRRGAGGMADVEAVVAGAARWLRPGGALVVEIAPHQADAAAGAARPGRVRRRPGPSRTWPAAPGCWWRGAEVAVPSWRPSDPAAVARAAELLRDGAVVAVPTDTVYGLAADPFQAGAVERLFALKERPAEVALPVLVAGRRAGRVGGRGPGAGRPGAGRPLLARAADPGGAPRRGFNVDLGGGSSGQVDGGRPLARPPGGPGPVPAVGPLAVTSANRHGGRRPLGRGGGGRLRGPLAGPPPAVRLAAVVDGGVCDGLPSTVVECRGPASRCLREGAIPWGGGPRRLRSADRRPAPGLTVGAPRGTLES